MRRDPNASGGGIFCLAFAAFVAAGFPLPAVESALPIPVEQTLSADVSETDPPTEPMQETPTPKPSDTALDTIAEVQIRSEFNDLRRELLDNRMKLVDWWLAVVAAFLTLIVVVAPIAGFFGFKRFREIEIKARRSVEITNAATTEAKSLVGEIKSKRDEAVSHLRQITSETAKEEPAKVGEAVQSAKENPSISLIDQVISAAILQQQQGNTDRATMKWLAVANIAEEIGDRELGARAWFSVGYLRAEESRLQDAVDGYDKAIRLNPDDANAFNNRGTAKSGLGRHDDALADYEEALRLNPDDAEVYGNRGAAKSGLGRHDKALADFDEAIRLKPDFAEAFNNRGNAKNALGRHEDALADYNEAIRLKPDYAEAFNHRGAVKNLVGRYEEALSDHDEAIRLKPNYSEAFLTRGIAKNGLGQDEDALVDYDKAIRLNPDFAFARLQRAQTLLKLGRSDEAREDLEKASELAGAADDEAMAEMVSQVYEQSFGGDS